MSNYLTTSVILPMHNAEQVIINTLNSILNQEIPFDELIIIDDASTDNSVALVQEFKRKHEPKLKIILLELIVNSGVSIARNQGIFRANGEVLFFCDADDEFHPRKNEWVQSFFLSHPDAISLVHGFNTQWEALPSIIRSTHFKKLPLWKNVLKNRGQGSSIIIRKSKTPFTFREQMRYSEDFELTNRLAHTKKLYFCKYSLSRLARAQGTEGGLSGDRWEMRKGELKTYLQLPTLSNIWYLALPLLIPYSITKHLFKIMIRK